MATARARKPMNVKASSWLTAEGTGPGLLTSATDPVRRPRRPSSTSLLHPARPDRHECDLGRDEDGLEGDPRRMRKRSSTTAGLTRRILRSSAAGAAQDLGGCGPVPAIELRRHVA